MSLSFLDSYLCLFNLLGPVSPRKTEALFNREGDDQHLFSLEHKTLAMPAKLAKNVGKKNGAMQLVRQYIQAFGGSPIRLQ